MNRPHLREDGIPTRADLRFMSPAERAIRAAIDAVEATGGSESLTKAVRLLSEAGDHVADHVEGLPFASPAPVAGVVPDALQEAAGDVLRIVDMDRKEVAGNSVGFVLALGRLRAAMLAAAPAAQGHDK